LATKTRRTFLSRAESQVLNSQQLAYFEQLSLLVCKHQLARCVQLAVPSETTSECEQKHGPQLLRVAQIDAHLFVAARTELQLAGQGERPSLLRRIRACLRYRPLLPGSSNLGEGRGPRDSFLPGRTGADVSRQLPDPIVSVRPTPPQARRPRDRPAGFLFSIFCWRCWRKHCDLVWQR